MTAEVAGRASKQCRGRGQRHRTSRRPSRHPTDPTPQASSRPSDRSGLPGEHSSGRPGSRRPRVRRPGRGRGDTRHRRQRQHRGDRPSQPPMSRQDPAGRSPPTRPCRTRPQRPQLHLPHTIPWTNSDQDRTGQARGKVASRPSHPSQPGGWSGELDPLEPGLAVAGMFCSAACPQFDPGKSQSASSWAFGCPDGRRLFLKVARREVLVCQVVRQPVLCRPVRLHPHSSSTCSNLPLTCSYVRLRMYADPTRADC